MTQGSHFSGLGAAESRARIPDVGGKDGTHDDFPALGGSSSQIKAEGAGPSHSFHSTRPPVGGSATGPIRPVAAVAPRTGAQPLPPIGQPSAAPGPASAGPAPASSGGLREEEKSYGLMGLLNVIRVTYPDLNMLAQGTDLTTLGLSLNTAELLYPTFAYPLSETPTKREAEFVLPYCYYMQSPSLKTSHMSKFQLETLFYIFYNMPKDTLQVLAAKELSARGWSYHKELKIWLTRLDPSKPPSGAAGAGAGAASSPAEGGGLVYFDVSSWSQKLFREPIPPAQLKQALMTEEELAALAI